MAASLPVRKDGSVLVPRALLERAGIRGGQARVCVQLGAGGLVLRPLPTVEPESCLRVQPGTDADGFRPYRDEDELDDAAKGYKF